MTDSDYDQLWTGMYPRLLRFFRRSSLAWLAEDLTADTFLRAWRARPGLTIRDSPYLWLAARSVLTSQFRHKAGLRNTATVLDITEAINGEWIADIAGTVDRELELAPQRVDIAAANLPMPQSNPTRRPHRRVRL